MGLTFSKFFQRLTAREEEDESPFMAGLDAAAKTTILPKLELGKSVTTIPAFGEVSFMEFMRLALFCRVDLLFDSKGFIFCLR